MTEILRREIALKCSPAHAFRVFTETIDLWWPRGHRRNADATLMFEAGPPGRIVELGPDGSEWTMARVAAFEPPSRLVLDWFPGSPVAPTNVEVHFAPAGDTTAITIVHRPVSVDAQRIWPERVARFSNGWDVVLPALRSFIDTNESKGG